MPAYTPTLLLFEKQIFDLEVCLGLPQTSKMESFGEIIDSWKPLIIIFAKRSILDVFAGLVFDKKCW